jgi:glyoxylase-like metal-dependent hydrolase (beta-lactamase superfamily II)
MRKKSSQEDVNPFPTGYYPPEETRIESGKVLGELREGSIFELGNRNVLVYETPGHSIDSVSFLVDGILFAGDTVKPSLKQEEVDHYAHFYESDINDYLSSLTKLSDISSNIDTICSGHTEPHHGHSILQEMKAALERIVDGKSSAQRLNTKWGLVEKHIYNNMSIFTKV